MSFNILLVHLERDEALGEAWRQHFGGQEGVSIVAGDICQVACDAIVSPANSFGFMDGGLDHALSEHFGWDLQDKLQERIKRRPVGELLIGEAEVIETGHAGVPWLISAPTMRVPMHIKTTVNAYLAMKAILAAVQQHAKDPPITTVAVPGLGTGVGGMPADVAALQMWTAYQEVVLGDPHQPADFGEAQMHQRRLNRLGRLYD